MNFSILESLMSIIFVSWPRILMSDVSVHSVHFLTDPSNRSLIFTKTPNISILYLNILNMKLYRKNEIHIKR